ncbi:MAG: nuclear transport factor 2 family protein [Gammaproteobacteria bacterium]
MRIFGLGFAVAVLVSACAITSPADDADQQMLAAAGNIVDAVNAKNSDQYVRDLADDVIVTMYDGEVRLRGRDAVRANREQHFLSHSEARNKLVHLVAIDQRVVMHDQVWLRAGQANPADIVEVFTFENGAIVRIDVLQPTDLFSQ